MHEELKTILDMLRNGAISVEDGTRLLLAIGMEDAANGNVQEVLTAVHAQTMSIAMGLNALAGLAPQEPEGVASGNPPRTGKWLRIRVDRTGKKPVNIRVPIGLVDTGMHLFGGASMRVDGVPIDTEKLWNTVRTASAGKIIDIDGDDGEHVEISVE